MSKASSMNTTNSSRADLRSRCYKFGLMTIDLVNHFPNQVSGKVIGNQLLRSATSAGANVVEARGSSSRLEFKKFYEIALKSANETEYWLQLARDSKIVEAPKIDILLDEISQLCRMLGSSVIKLKQRS
jgi:four helix bundle protein